MIALLPQKRADELANAAARSKTVTTQLISAILILANSPSRCQINEAAAGNRRIGCNDAMRVLPVMDRRGLLADRGQHGSC